ncbi:arginine deiminase-related protein [Gallaecimonas sp. GXIMD4217]|uniref:arginine deiminase-related protein n=1 Tax=Gallaecimonas sp. GXIMD4217 TaxID=3131927 RepID=UPI00311B35A2
MQNTNCLLMVPPVDFAFNPQTARDNHYQHQPSQDQAAVRDLALAEYGAMVARLREAGVRILELDKDDQAVTPDAVFPNNWFMTRPDASLWICPMKTANRNAERRVSRLQALLAGAGFALGETHWLDDGDKVLEGTGALVFDHEHRRVFAALSERCDETLLRRFARAIGYQVVAFATRSRHGGPVYHTNVVMALGQAQAVACLEVVAEQDRDRVRVELGRHHKLVEISEAQMEAFCGNMLEVLDGDGEPLWVLSQTAFDHLDAQQKASLGRLLAVAIPTIESVGGGSARCMLAEIFLPG